MGPVRVCFGLSILAGVLGAQTLATIAGRDNVRGFDGDGGPATAATLALANLKNTCDPVQFEQTSHIATDDKGNIYFTDSQNQRIRRIDPAGIVTTIAGTGDPPQTNARCEPNTPTAPGFFNPAGIAIRPNGNLIVADQQNNRIRELTPAGTISTIAGSGLHQLYVPGITATASPMDWPGAVTVDANNAVYFVEVHSNRIARIGADGRLTTVAGTGSPTVLNKPMGIAFDRAGNLLIADTGNHRILRMSPSGALTTLAATGLNAPMDVKPDALGNIYIADTGNHRIRRIDPSGNIATVASGLNLPCAIAVDANNDLYIIDWQNYLIRKLSFPAISPGGIVNGASFIAPVAPGGIFSIFGAGFTPELLSAAAPLPLELAGVSVLVNGAPVPLYFVSPGQINAQLPYSISPGAATAVVVTPTSRTAPVEFTVAPVAIGTFAIANENGAINSPDRPESRGRVLVCYVTGLGPVSPPVAEGQPAPLSPLSESVRPTATIGGVPAQVFFAGLTPNLIGLGQVNLIVPANAPTGDAIPLVIGSSKPVTVAIR